MKKVILVLALFAVTITAVAQDKEGVTVTVTVENVLADGGTVLASLHDQATFMKGAGVLNAAAPAKKGEVTMTFDKVKPGTYAIMVMHDANDNKQMDFESTGMPTESYGISGGINPYGPPVFEEAKFEVGDENLDFQIRF